MSSRRKRTAPRAKNSKVKGADVTNDTGSANTVSTKDTGSAHSPAASGRDDSGIVASRALPMRAFSKSLPMELMRAREAVMRRFRPGLRNHGVTEQQWRILRALAHSGPMEVSQLAEVTCLLAPSLSRILPELESRQLVSRRQADSDLRRSVISLERKGLRLIAKHAPFSEDVYERIAAAFGPERLAQLFTLLRELEECLQSEDETDRVSRSSSRAGSDKRER